MKKRIFTFMCAVALSLCATAAFASGRFLPNLQKMEGLTSVYVGQGLLRMLGDGMADNMKLANDMFDAGEIIKYIKSVEVVSADTKKTANYLRQQVDEALKKTSGLELAMETEEDKEITKIYVVPSADGKTYTRMLVINGEPDEYNVIDMTGNIPIDILSKLDL